MVGLKIGDTFLDLDTKTSLNITMTNPIFDKDKVNRSFSYPFKLPASALNKRLLLHQERLDTTNAQPRFAASLYISNIRYEVGELVIISATPDYFKCNFRNYSFALFDELDEISLQSLPLPDTNFDFRYRPEYLFTGIRESGKPLVLKINDDIFTSEAGNEAQFLSEINAIYPNSAFEGNISLNSWTFFFITAAIDPAPIVTLQPTNTSPLDNHYFSVGSLADGNLDQLASDWQDHLNSIAQSAETHAFPVIHSPNFFSEEENPDYSGYINYYSPAEAYADNPDFAFDAPRSQHSIVPYVFAKTVLESLVTADYVAQIDSDLISNPELANLIIHNNLALDNFLHREDYVTDAEQQRWRNVWATSYKLANHLPDITAKAFLTKIASTFCHYFSYKNGALQAKNCAIPLRTTPIDWTSKAEPDYTQTYNEAQGYLMTYNRQDDPRTANNQLQNLQEGNGKLEFSSEWYSFFQLNNTDTVESTRGFWSLVRSDEPGTSPEFNIQNEPSLRLLFYRGMLPDPNGNSYPFASAGNIGPQGQQVGNYTLHWQGEHGLFEKFWKEYVEMLATGKEVQKVLRLNIHDLLNLKDFETPVRYIANPKGNIKAVVKKVQFKVSTQGIAPAKVTFITL